MSKSVIQPRALPVAELLHAVQSQSTKDCTHTLHSLEKMYRTYPTLRTDDATHLFHECRRLVAQSGKKEVRYNALRLLKYIVTTDDFLRIHAKDVWTLFRKTLFDPDGNVRNAGLQLFSRYRFGLSCIAEPWELRRKKRKPEAQKEMDRFQKVLIEQFLELYALEQSYAKDHADEEELWRKSFGRVTPSWETKDKILKTIRRAIEESTRGMRLEELAAKHGYTLPNHWSLDSFIDEESMRSLPEGDREGAILSTDGKDPVYISAPPQPKDFSTFEEYQEALALREHFQRHVETVNTILSSGKNEEEIEAAMAALGFQKHDDAPCGRSWCIERYGCVSVNLVHMQRFFEEHVLDVSLQPENRLLSEREILQSQKEGCLALPQEWCTEGSREQCALRWFLELYDWLSWNCKKVRMEDLAREPVSAAFLREAYWWTLHVLRHRPLPSSWQGRVLIEEFLRVTDLLDKKDAEELVKVFLGQQDILI